MDQLGAGSNYENLVLKEIKSSRTRFCNLAFFFITRKYEPFFVNESSLSCSSSSSSWSASSCSSSTSSSSSGMPLMKWSCFSALIGEASIEALVLWGNDNEQRGIVLREVDKLIRWISLLDRKYKPSPYLVNEKLEMPLEKMRN